MKRYWTLGFIALALSSCNTAQQTLIMPPPPAFNVSGQWNMILTNENNNNASFALGITLSDVNGAINGTVYLPGQPNNQPYPFTGVRTPQNTSTMNIGYDSLALSITGTFTSLITFTGRYTSLIDGVSQIGAGPVTMTR